MKRALPQGSARFGTPKGTNTVQTGESKERTFESTFVIVMGKPRRKPKDDASQSK